jgi:hypothetical protein
MHELQQCKGRQKDPSAWTDNKENLVNSTRQKCLKGKGAKKQLRGSAFRALHEPRCAHFPICRSCNCFPDHLQTAILLPISHSSPLQIATSGRICMPGVFVSLDSFEERFDDHDERLIYSLESDLEQHIQDDHCGIGLTEEDKELQDLFQNVKGDASGSSLKFIDVPRDGARNPCGMQVTQT